MKKEWYICAIIPRKATQTTKTMSKVTVYKASAGSGKTFTLAVQYIRLLITTNPLEYRHTLAVTFTNKATAEMKDRILEQLYGISKGLESSKKYLKALKKDLEANGIKMKDEDITKKCGEALGYILHDYSRFRIETIDSFFQSVLRNLAHELGLNARLQVDLNDKQILSQAVDNLVDGLAGRTHEERNIEDWIDDYVKDQLENSESWDVRNKIKKFSSIIFKEEYMNRDDAFRQSICDEEKIKSYRNSLRKIKVAAQEVMQEVAKSLTQVFSQFDGDLAKAISGGSWVLQYADKLMAGNYAEANITEKRMEALQQSETLVKKADQNNTALLSKLDPIRKAILETEVERKKYLTIANTIDLSLQHLNPMRLLNQIEQEVTEITNDTNRFILAKTPILLSRLIEGSDAPFVFEKMGTLFHNVMIDEFQDTSQLQWKNFKVLLLESQASGGSDLLVGDVKQSIYRFRNGDWHILYDIKNQLEGNELQINTLNTNFRSDVNIIDFNNKFFKAAAPLIDTKDEKGIVQELYEDIEQAWPDDKERKGYVRIQLKTNKEQKGWEDLMLEDLCEQIRSLKAGGLKYKDMCILLRSRTSVPKLIDYVGEKLGVKLISDEGFKLYSSVTLGMIMAALRMLWYKGEDPVSERYLVKHYLCQVLKKQDISVQDFATAAIEDVLPEAFVAHQDELREHPLQELCEEIYNTLELSEIGSEDAYVLTFFDELANYLRNGVSDIQSFLEYWEQDMQYKSIPACEVDGISVVTIHKSKGLQYHTVLMPYCDTPMEEIRSDEILWCEAEDETYSAMGSMPLNGAKAKFMDSEFYDDYRNEQLQRRIEELNILYVAFTRAEHNLYVWGDGTRDALTHAKLLEYTMTCGLEGFSKKESNGITTWDMGQPVTVNEEKEKEDDNRMSPTYEEQNIRFTSHNRRFDFRQSNEADQYIRLNGDEEVEETKTVDGLTFIEQGKLLHEIFSYIERKEQVESVVASYRDKGIISNDQQQQRITTLITKALENPKVSSWFDGSMKVMNECEIVHLDEKGKTKSRRPDRVMLSDTEIVIVDFKFGRPKPEEYDPQVQVYMKLIQEMYPDHHVTGWLWYVYRNQVDNVKMP